LLDYLLQYSLFLAEVATLVIAIGVVIGFLFNAIRRATREYTAEHLEVKNLNRRFEQMADVLNHDLLNPNEHKAHIKAKKKEYKQRTKEQKKGKTARSRVFVLDFDDDFRASAVEHLREEINAVMQVARPEDEVVRCGSRARAAWSIPAAWRHRSCAG
jgi:serine protease SohB